MYEVVSSHLRKLAQGNLLTTSNILEMLNNHVQLEYILQIHTNKCTPLCTVIRPGKITLFMSDEHGLMINFQMTQVMYDNNIHKQMYTTLDLFRNKTLFITDQYCIVLKYGNSSSNI